MDVWYPIVNIWVSYELLGRVKFPSGLRPIVCSFQYNTVACNSSLSQLNFLKSTGHVMHQQFNIQQL